MKLGMGRAAAEVIIVVAGILIAFALDASWERWASARWEQTQLQALEVELSDNLTRLDEIISAHDRTASALRAILDFATQEPVGSRRTFPDSVVTALVSWRTSDIYSGTLSALLSSGELGDLGSPALRERLALWPAIVNDAQEDETLAVEFVEMVLTPALAGEGVLARAHAARSGPRMARPEVDLGVTVTATLTLSDLTAVRLSHERIARGSLLNVQDEIRGILNLIAAELGAK